MIGERIGNYVIVKEIGHGGMSTVYEARHIEFDARAAVKVLHPEHAERPDLVRRFLNEGRAVSRVRHPGVVRIHDCGQLSDGRAYIIMEFLEGEPLSHRLARQVRLSPAEATRLARQMASALCATHQQGIIHRDLKPDNVMIVADPEAQGGERVRILDFGIAKVALRPDLAGDSQPLTQAGMIMGTPAYMSPEQCQEARDVDARTDVYSLGVILYQMLSGQLPFTGPPIVIMSYHLHRDPTPLSERAPGLPADLAVLVGKMMRKDRAERPSMEEVKQALSAILERIGGGGGEGTYHALSAPGAAQQAPPTLDSAPMSRTSTYASRVPRSMLALAVLLAAGGAGGLALFRALSPRQGGSHPTHAAPPDLWAPPPDLWTPPPDLWTPPPDLLAPRDLAEAAQRAKTRWVLTSDPAGAEVIRASDGQVLGRTPLHLEREPSANKERILFRRSGYYEQAVELDLSRSGRKSVELVPKVL